MNPEDVKETIRNYDFYLNERERLVTSLGNLGGGFMGIGLSSKDERVQKRIEKIDRNLSYFEEAMEHAGLTDREWTVVDCSMQGMSSREIGSDIFNKSHGMVGHLINSAAKKISYFIVNGHIQ